MGTREGPIARMKAVQASCQATIARIESKQQRTEETLAEMRRVINRWDNMRRHSVMPSTML